MQILLVTCYLMGAINIIASIVFLALDPARSLIYTGFIMAGMMLILLTRIVQLLETLASK